MKLAKFLDLYDNWNGTLVINDRDCERFATVDFKNVDRWLNGNGVGIANAEVMAFGFYDNDLCVRIDI